MTLWDVDPGLARREEHGLRGLERLIFVITLGYFSKAHRCNFWSKLTILFVVEHTVNSHTLMLNSTWNFFARPQKNSGRITQCLASRSRLPKVFNFWGFSFLRRKLAGFCTDFHELFMKKIQHKCTYEHDNWRRHTDKSVALLKHCTLREFQSSLTDFTMPKSSCVAAA